MATTDRIDIIQSYILTTAKYDFSVYEKRILYRIVQTIQKHIDGIKLNEHFKIQEELFGAEFTMPISAFLRDKEDKNYPRIKKAFEELQRKLIKYEDDEMWFSAGIIGGVTLRKRTDLIEFFIDKRIYKPLLSFSKGFRKLQLKTAMEFDSVYAMRFYELMSGQKQPITYSIENLKEMFQIQDKYDRVNDFKKYVLDIAIRELDKCSPYTFTYKMNKTGRSFTSVTFYPKYQPQFRDSELEKRDLQKQVSPAWDLPKNTLDYLKNGFDLTPKEIKQNIDLLKQAQVEIDNFINFMSQVKPRANRAKNPKGYLINAIKKELKVI